MQAATNIVQRQQRIIRRSTADRCNAMRWFSQPEKSSAAARGKRWNDSAEGVLTRTSQPIGDKGFDHFAKFLLLAAGAPCTAHVACKDR